MKTNASLAVVLMESFKLLSCSYDEEADKVNQYQRLNLEGLEKIEIG